MFDTHLVDAATALIGHCRTNGFKLASAESCTGGLVGALLTAIPGSSEVYERGFITYSNEAKISLLGVEAAELKQFGAVSSVVAAQMAAGALRKSEADFAVSITGIAGPGGGTAIKPVGLVWFGIAARHAQPRAEERRFGDRGREGVRLASVATAVTLFLTATGAAASGQELTP